MKKVIQFGETVEGYNIPVLNEREVRAAAGILFFFTFLSLMFIIFKENFVMIKYVITFFFTDFVIRVFVNPRFSPTLIIGRLIVSKQTPEYVAAAPKKFAWYMGVGLSATMFIIMVVLNSFSIVSGIICLVCLIFLFFESVFGICLGCLFYPLFYKEKLTLCPGDICEVKPKQTIQKVTFAQLVVVFASAIFIVVLAVLFQGNFSKKTIELSSRIHSIQIK